MRSSAGALYRMCRLLPRAICHTSRFNARLNAPRPSSTLAAVQDVKPKVSSKHDDFHHIVDGENDPDIEIVGSSPILLSKWENTAVTFKIAISNPDQAAGTVAQSGSKYSEGCEANTMSYFWLRDNCRCPHCVNQDTMQRAFDTFSIPQNIKPKQVKHGKKGVYITWANDQHVSLYRWDWIAQRVKNIQVPAALQKQRQRFPAIPWDRAIGKDPPSVSYDEIMAGDSGVASWTHKIMQYGFCYVDGCPISPEKTQELLERISFIRNTHYGGFYDFTADLTMKDTAYTNLALPAHTDTTYFTDPAGLQMFHLLSHIEGDGGESLLVDGYKASNIMFEESPHEWRSLAEFGVPSHASGNEGITIAPAFTAPVITPSKALHTLVPQIRWNNDDRGVVPIEYEKKWYAAASKWNEVLKRKDMEYWAQLTPGRPLIFDNWRVLHGRSAFTGKRRICGGYINHDDYISRWRNTNFTREQALEQVMSGEQRF